ncbi:MAG TPA: hypothetical protein VFZ98_00420 [Vicinamibacterales bacterium]
MTISQAFLLLNLRVIGVILGILVVVNLFVPSRFGWRAELARLSLLNRQIFQAHGVFLILTLALFSALLLTSADALLEPTRLSRAVLLGLTIFWGLRMAMQWWFYSPEIWRGNPFFTKMHVVFSVTWIYMTGVFGTALWFVGR